MAYRPAADVNDAIAHRSEAWDELAQIFVRRALKAARNNYDHKRAIQWMRAAEGCIWQATADSEAIDLKDIDV